MCYNLLSRLSPRKQQVSLATVSVPSSRNVASVRPCGFLGMEWGREEIHCGSLSAHGLSEAEPRRAKATDVSRAAGRKESWGDDSAALSFSFHGCALGPYWPSTVHSLRVSRHSPGVPNS